MAWISKGTIFTDQYNYEEALKCYDKAIEIDPHNSRAWYSRGMILNTKGKYEEAKKCYNRASELESLKKSRHRR